jgi:hypothetical protein
MMSSQDPSIVDNPLTNFSEEDLREELKRRGWHEECLETSTGDIECIYPPVPGGEENLLTADKVHCERKKQLQNLKIYRVPASWEMSAIVKIRAESPNEALEKVYHSGDIPDDADFVDGSFQINEEIFKELNDLPDDTDLEY